MQKTDRKKAKARADWEFSRYVRERDNWTCVTCGVSNWRNENKMGPVMECGHLITRSCESVRWHERNGFCQCKSCNMIHEHRPERYTQWFLRRYGQEAYEDLIRESRTVNKVSVALLNEIADYYKGLRRELECRQEW